MPANLPPQYFKAEQRYLQARTLEERIAATQELIRVTPKHKGTEKLLKVLKRRLAKLNRELEERKKRKVGRGQPFAVKKGGAAQVVLVGLPGSGKSTLLRKLTKAEPEVADHPFTTTEPVPGMMEFEDVQIQLVEVPAIVEGSSLGKGLGMKPLSLARNADAIALVIDSSRDPLTQARILMGELEAAGIRLNRPPPAVSIERRSSGGIEIKGGHLVDGGDERIKRILAEHRIHNAFLNIWEPLTVEELEEALAGTSVYRKGFFILTKLDAPDAGKVVESLKNEFGALSAIPSCGRPEDVKREIFAELGLIRVYTKRPREERSKRPLMLPKGSTVLDVARAVHKDFERGLKFARVWGSTKFPGQRVPRDYVVADRDIVELHL